jgi:hypothetical protein
MEESVLAVALIKEEASVSVKRYAPPTDNANRELTSAHDIIAFTALGPKHRPE